jgi:hypothetical protein
MESKFLPFMCRLRFFEINAFLSSTFMRDFNTLSFVMSSLYISLTSPATLEHLRFNIKIHCSYGNNFSEKLRHANVWRHLDSITTHPTGSRLRRVDININCALRYGDLEEFDEDEVKKAVLDGLPLLHTKGILFVEAVLARSRQSAPIPSPADVSQSLPESASQV